MFGSWGITELLIVLAIVLLLFGSAKLPKLARSLGTAVNEFKDGIKSSSSEADESASQTSEDDKA
jgi:sec-independent protein translocase protein TatA